MDMPSATQGTAPSEVANMQPPARWVAPAQARLFLGVSVPPAAQRIFESTLRTLPQYIEHTTPHDRLHVTLAFLGDVEHPQQYLSRLLKPMPQTFVPTITYTHVGRGLERLQLWAYAHPSTILLNLRQQLVARLKQMRFPLPKDHADFVPHTRLADLFLMTRGIGIADQACSTSFAFREVTLYESTRHHQEVAYIPRGSIIL